MIEYELGVEDLANMHFAISPLNETVLSLWALTDPSRHTLHLPWVRATRAALDADDARLLYALVVARSRTRPGFGANPSRPLPDFLNPRPLQFAPRFDEELARVRQTPAQRVRRDVVSSHAPDPVPEPLLAATASDDDAVAEIREAICDALERLWRGSLEPVWPEMRLVLESDTTYRARQLAVGGARLLFADIHPNVSWAGGVLAITEMIGDHRIAGGGRGMLLLPSIFAYKPATPIDPEDPPHMVYPSRGIGTLWSPAPPPDSKALVALVGTPRARLLRMLAEPLPTIELARRLRVTPSAVSQHVRVLHGAGLLSRTRDGRHVLYRRTETGERLAAGDEPGGAGGRHW